MSCRIDILAPGYAYNVPVTIDDGILGNSKSSDFNMRARGSCCLVRSGKTSFLFDTLGPWDSEFLLQKLSGFKLYKDDVDYVVCSHSHPDHIGNLNLFTKSKRHYVGTSVYKDNVYFISTKVFPTIGEITYKLNANDGDNNDNIKRVPLYADSRTFETFNCPNIVLKHTPGHTMECITMLVDNCETYGRVALSGDLFENSTDVDNSDIWIEAGSQNEQLQQLYRNEIYSMVDYILPGHGDIFKTEPTKRLHSRRYPNFSILSKVKTE